MKIVCPKVMNEFPLVGFDRKTLLRVLKRSSERTRVAQYLVLTEKDIAKFTEFADRFRTSLLEDITSEEGQRLLHEQWKVLTSRLSPTREDALMTFLAGHFLI